MAINSKVKIRLYSFFQICLDVLIIYSILCFSLYACYLCGADYEMGICVQFTYLPFVIVIINALSRVYGKNVFYPGIDISRVEELKRMTWSVIAGYTIIFAYYGVAQSMTNYFRVALLMSFVLTLVILPSFHILFKYLCGKYKILTRKVLVAGADESSRKFAQSLERNRYLNISVEGFIDDSQTGDRILGKLSDCRTVAVQYDIPYLVVSLPTDKQEKYMPYFLDVFRHILLVPQEGLYAQYEAYPMSINHRYSFEISNNLQMKIFRLGKIILEFCIACLVLPLVFPVGLIIALGIKLTSLGPVFYKAKRIGRNGKEIYVYKFRTMYKNAEKRLKAMLDKSPELRKEWEERFKLKNDPRITPLGKLLRKTSLDELPQFINVLKGDMSIIGPRPIVEEEVKYYGDNFRIFSMVKPGITGLWQISGRSDTDYDTRVRLDMYYVSNWSIWLDYYIFLNTFIVVLCRRGAE